MANCITKHIPNTITMCNLVCGCAAAYHAFFFDYETAFFFILLAAVFDFFDGMTARLLGVSGPIGKELDSLADVVSFGVAPSAMVFSLLCSCEYPEWAAPFSNVIPWFAFVIAAFSALRLAKFNLDERQTTSFIGVPTPANTLIWASLIVGAEAWLTNVGWAFYLILALIFLSSYLLIAELPLFALKFKHWGWQGNAIKYIFILSCIPLLALLGMSGFAAIIVWYVILSAINNKCNKQA